MALDVRFRPLEKWPDSPKLQRRKSPFSAKFSRVLDMLERELKHLRAKDIVIEAGFTNDDIRNDGWPRSSAVPRHHPGVILYFDGSTGKMRMPSGTYAGWQTNLYAIALTLERLRAIDRYGVTVGNEQYQGFKALPAATTKLATLDDAAQFVSIQSGGTIWSGATIIGNPNAYREAYRFVAARLHPDGANANEHLWNLLTEAKELLDAHHGLKKAGAS